MELNRKLFDAVINNNLSQVIKLLQEGANPNVKGSVFIFTELPDELTPLIIAARDNNLDIVRELLKYGAKPNIKGEITFQALSGLIEEEGNEELGEESESEEEIEEELGNIPTTALIEAIKNDNLEMVNQLLNYRANPNLGVGFGITPLIEAIRDNNIPMIRLLITRGADPNFKEPDVYSPLEFAIAARKNAYIIRELVSLGANPNQDSLASRLLTQAIKEDNLGLLKVLLEHGVNPNLKKRGEYPSLFLAVENNNLAMVKELLDHGAEISPHEDFLSEPIEANNLALVKILLDHGANPDLPNRRGNTPLILAVENNNLALVKLLLQYPVNINQKDFNGDTALLAAIKNSNLELVKILLEAGANPNERNEEGENPLFIATGLGDNRLEIVTQLLEAGANPNETDVTGDNLLTLVILEEADIEVIKKFLEFGFNPNLIAPGRELPLISAISIGNLEIIDQLMKYGANPYLRAPSENSAFDILEEFIEEEDEREIIRSLLNRNPLDLSNSEGVTNLAVLVGNPAKLPILETYFDQPDLVRPIVNQQDSQGNTALIYAVTHNPNPEVIKFLLENGANPLIRNNQGYSALDYARDLGEKNIISLIQRY